MKPSYCGFDLFSGELEWIGLGSGTLLVEEGIENARSRLKRVGNAERGGFGLARLRSVKKRIDRLAKEFHPAFELLFFKRQDGVLGPGLTFVFAGSEKHFGPEGIHGGKMMLPIDLRDLIENGPENIVAIHAVVKGIDQRLDVLICADVFQQMKLRQHTLHRKPGAQ